MVAKVSGRTESMLALIRSRPASARACAVRVSPRALVVSDVSTPSTWVRATMSTSPRRSSGSPPVNRTSRMPRRCTPIVISRTTSSSVSVCSVGSQSRPSAGMQ